MYCTGKDQKKLIEFHYGFLKKIQFQFSKNSKQRRIFGTPIVEDTINSPNCFFFVEKINSQLLKTIFENRSGKMWRKKIILIENHKVRVMPIRMK